MTMNNTDRTTAGLIAFLAAAIALIPISYAVGAEWLRITLLVLAIAGIATISFFLLRTIRRQRG